jgi:hypothetical protein
MSRKGCDLLYEIGRTEQGDVTLQIGPVDEVLTRKGALSLASHLRDIALEKRRDIMVEGKLTRRGVVVEDDAPESEHKRAG